MAKKKEDLGGVWRTVGGRRIFIKDGQDLYEAMNDSGKFTNLKKTNSQRKTKFDANLTNKIKTMTVVGADNKIVDMNMKEIERIEDAGSYYDIKFKDGWGTKSKDKVVAINGVETKEYLASKEKTSYKIDDKTISEQDLRKEFERKIEEYTEKSIKKGGFNPDEKESIAKYYNKTEKEVDEAIEKYRNGKAESEYIKKVASAKNDKELNEADKYYKEKTGKNWDSDKEKHEYELYKRAREDENSIDPMTENSIDWKELDRKYKDRYEREQSSMKDINDLQKLAESSLSEKPHDYYNKKKETRDEYLKKYDKYNGDERPEKMTADDVWSSGYKESMYEQFENRIGNYKGDDYEINKIQDTIAIIDKEASGSLHNKYLSIGGKYAEEYDRKQYGDAKIDSAIMREQEMLRRGYTNIATNINPRGLVNSFEYSDMIITGEKNGIQVSVNYNKKGESAISLKGRNKNGGYGELMITEDNYKTVRDMIDRGSIGSDFRESRPYSDYKIDKLTASESKEYYDNINKHYEENKKDHYYDSDFFEKHKQKVKQDIISKRTSNSIYTDKNGAKIGHSMVVQYATMNHLTIEEAKKILGVK